MRSTSSMVKEYLLEQMEGYQFTSKMLTATLALAHSDCDVSHGGVSGALNAFSGKGVKLIEKNGRELVYILESKEELEKVRVLASSRGGHGNPGGPRRSRNVPPSRESVKEHLLSIGSRLEEELLAMAIELEQIQTPLAMWSTGELLEELKRRTADGGIAK